ncbi:Serine peptidase family S28 [Penicillium frequentans]|uniref:Serine peptidase family S28 n=1 Tax=Penicillium frequentans TaxID=3151616 RepID=A0AAD6GCK8_9EURO|nr:Serine peptidase family S28 [Penicillium glabrum]
MLSGTMWWGLVLSMAGSAASMGISSPFRRDLKLMAQMGISPDVILSKKESVHTLVARNSDEIKEEYVMMPIDHTNSSVGTYKNRYWVQEEYYQQGGPVFIYDVGESTAESAAKVQLGNSTSMFVEMLAENGAMGIVWEHRYYGKSLPYNVNVDTPPEHFAYLNNEQALADIPFFAQNFTRENYNETDLTPSGSPWVMIGGSYSGMRSAFSRSKYPDTIFASFASSAPVEARIDMSMYFDQVYDAMVANGYLNCTRDIKAAMEYVDAELDKNAESAAAIKQLFFGAGAEDNNNGDFTTGVGGIFGFFQSYGFGGGEGSLASFCEHLETDPYTGTVAGPRGFAPYLGNEYVAKRFASFPAFIELVNFNYYTNCGGLDETQPVSCVLNPKATDPDVISWTWQFCTEWGYFQTNNIGPHSLLSKYQSLEYVQYTCNRQFPDAVAAGILPKHPLTEETNEQTGGWTIRPSNVYWSGGEFDPWRTLSPSPRKASLRRTSSSPPTSPSAMWRRTRTQFSVTSCPTRSIVLTF